MGNTYIYKFLFKDFFPHHISSINLRILINRRILRKNRRRIRRLRILWRILRKVRRLRFLWWNLSNLRRLRILWWNLRNLRRLRIFWRNLRKLRRIRRNFSNLLFRHFFRRSGSSHLNLEVQVTTETFNCLSRTCNYLSRRHLSNNGVFIGIIIGTQILTLGDQKISLRSSRCI